MKITWNELAVDLTGYTSEDLLSEWRWLVPDNFLLRMVSTLGDAFLEDSDGKIYWLDVGSAELQCIAKDTDDFFQLRQQPDNANEWFAPQLIGDLLSSGAVLQVGQCFSYNIPPTLNGKFSLENLQPRDLTAHFRAHGKIQRQVKSLPIGTEIKAVELER
ncbi:MAG: DUF1851 domain-containing protein [Desulfuromonadaceae bacterium]|nr:DUF1851 domain-containing protein [Desulfuromonadaceae bacterium]MDD2848947.1 DUF1851 domain-containing protein [Desulfuromonadaceae bacterium]MDD4130296.1 DUF1851 domain-containing protein [Desulfuromonadaceae bacterium]